MPEDQQRRPKAGPREAAAKVSEHTKALNDSGFLYQLRIEHLVRQLRSGDVEVISREHAWTGEGEAGFVDLVVSSAICRFVVECKRQRGAKWYFLAEKQPRAQPASSKIRAQWTYHGQNLKDDAVTKAGIADFFTNPPMWEAAFCVVKGQDEQRPLLERTAWSLLNATEALAAESLRLEPPYGGRVWLPMIVTSAELFVHLVEPDSISLESGELVEAMAEPVDWISFRKSLRQELSDEFHRGPTRQDQIGVDKAGADRERSVVVVRGTSLEQLLAGENRFLVRDTKFGSSAPWLG
jgi:hypothetical protein